MLNMTKIGRGVAATGVAGLLSIGLATSAFADPPTGSDANQPENWEPYLVEEGYVNPECTKLNDGFEGNSWTSTGDYALVVLKNATYNDEYWEVEDGETIETDLHGEEPQHDISHIIVCTADMEEETSTPTPSTSTPGTSTPPPSGPVVETDVPADAGSNGLPVVLGGAAVLAGLGLAAGAMRRKGQH